MDLANSIVSLQPGMYILRHPKTGLPPISLSRAAANAAHNGQIQALFTPGTEGSVLRGGSDCIVMQVLHAPVDLLVTAYLEKAGATVPVLKIEKIALEGDSQPGQKKAIDVPSKGISIIGHIERRGDLVATSGNALGEPTAELRLEGFQVMWPDRPEGVDLAYSAHIEGVGETSVVKTGAFCGTKNSAKRVLGLTLTLIGSQANNYKLDGDAFFSGGYSSKLVSGAPIAGPSGMEHLTGLRIEVSAAPKKASSPWDPSAKTKVFTSAKPILRTR